MKKLNIIELHIFDIMVNPFNYKFASLFAGERMFKIG